MVEEDLDALLDREAVRAGVSKAELVRRLVRERLRPLPPIEDDPLFQMIGADGGEPSTTQPFRGVRAAVEVDWVAAGARLRILRRWRGMTQAQLSALSGLSQAFVSMVEHGQRLLDRRSHITAQASALRVSETDLVGGPHLSADRRGRGAGRPTLGRAGPSVPH
jgi:hypothetical protein